MSQQQSLLSSAYEPFYSYVSVLSQTNASVLKAIVNSKDTLANSKFAVHSAQRIKGADSTGITDPSFSELRANEQWEMVSR
jgi:hypothetical protein